MSDLRDQIAELTEDLNYPKQRYVVVDRILNLMVKVKCSCVYTKRCKICNRTGYIEKSLKEIVDEILRP